MLAPAATFLSQGTAHAAACGTGGGGGAASTTANGAATAGGGGFGAGCAQNGDEGTFTTTDFNAPLTNQFDNSDPFIVGNDNEFRSQHDFSADDGGEANLCDGGIAIAVAAEAC
jgi:hypothetical protein